MDDNPGRIPLDQNRRNIVAGVSTTDGKTILPAEINAADNGVLVHIAGPLGQAIEASSIPVTIASDQSAIPVTLSTTYFTLRYADDGTTTYIGNAVPGTATSAASWQIRKLTDATLTILYANGSSAFNQIWDNRASLSYS